MIAITSGGGGTAAQAYTLKVAYRFPEGVQTPDIFVRDEFGDPLVINGVLVVMEVAPCSPGQCEVDELYPAPPGQKWLQFHSVEPIPPDGADSGQLDIFVEVTFSMLEPIAPTTVLGDTGCGVLGISGTDVGTWHSDDRDDLYGIEVIDFFGEMSVPLPVFDDGFETGDTSQWSRAIPSFGIADQ